MGRHTTIIPVAPVGRMIQKAGAHRVSLSAANELADMLTAFAMRVSTRAVAITKHTGKKTVSEKDIKLAASDID